jgi:hypothetical protein
LGALCTALLAVYLPGARLHDEQDAAERGQAPPAPKTAQKEPVPASVLADLRRLWPWFAGGMAAVVVVIVLPSFVMRQISTWQTRGQHELALAAGRALQTCYPPIRGDVFFVLQMAQSESAIHRDNPSRLAFAQGVEFWRENRLDLARQHFEQSLQEDDHFLTRGYLSATLLREGVLLFQQAQPAAAAAMFKRVCEVFPGHIQATYFAMVAEAAKADFVASAKSAGELRDLQRYFRLPGIAAMGQAHLHEAWAEYRAGRMDDAWHQYRKSVDRGAWE